MQAISLFLKGVMKNILLIISAILVFFIVILLFVYTSSLKAVDSKNTTIFTFEIKEKMGVNQIIKELKTQGLIKNELITKTYVKLNKKNNVKAGIYELNQSMSVKEIFNKFVNGSNINPDAITVTIPEGYTLEEIALVFEEKTDNDNLLKLWNSKEFVDTVIKKYDFITEEVKDKDIKYALEGYFFPSTYEFINKNVTGEDIAYKLLDEMEKRLSKYDEEIKKSQFSYHEILTFASIIEYEAILDEDRYLISGVFHNRLDIGMKLESCATLDYALNTHKIVYSYEDMKVESPYNTYHVNGLPVGPGNNPSENSIKAVLYPKDTDYFYFLASVYDNADNKTYYAKTYQEHLNNKNKYLSK